MTSSDEPATASAAEAAAAGAAVAGIRARLTGPGGEFELIEQDVRGVRLPVFANRRRALRDWLVDSAACGDREYLAQGDRRLSFADHAAVVGPVVGGSFL
jgi:hypothetical protein